MGYHRLNGFGCYRAALRLCPRIAGAALSANAEPKESKQMKINNVILELEIVTETEANGIKTLCKAIKKKEEDLTGKILDILNRAVPEDEWGNLSLTEAKKVQSDLVKVAKALDWKEQTIRNICTDWIGANCGIKNEIAETTEAKAEAEAEAGAEAGAAPVADPEAAAQLSELNKRFQAAKADKKFAKRIEGKSAQEVIDAFITFESGKAQKVKRLAKAKKPAAKSRAAAAAKVANN